MDEEDVAHTQRLPPGQDKGHLLRVTTGDRRARRGVMSGRERLARRGLTDVRNLKEPKAQKQEIAEGWGCWGAGGGGQRAHTSGWR